MENNIEINGISLNDKMISAILFYQRNDFIELTDQCNKLADLVCVLSRMLGDLCSEDDEKHLIDTISELAYLRDFFKSLYPNKEVTI